MTKFQELFHLQTMHANSTSLSRQIQDIETAYIKYGTLDYPKSQDEIDTLFILADQVRDAVMKLQSEWGRKK